MHLALQLAYTDPDVTGKGGVGKTSLAAATTSNLPLNYRTL